MWLNEMEEPHVSTRSATATDERLRALVAKILQLSPEEIADEASFYDDLGADSLERVAITTEIEMEFGVTLSAEEAASILSLAQARTVLAAKNTAPANTEPDSSDAVEVSQITDASPGTAPSSFDLVHRLVGRHVDAGHGADRAYLDPDMGPVKYADLHRAAADYAAALDRAGVARGSRCVVVAEDSVATVIAVLGLWWHGCVPVPVSPALPARDLEFIVTDCAAAAVHLDGAPARRADSPAALTGLPRFTGDEVRAALGSTQGTSGSPCQRYDWPGDAEVLVQYTSGSTGAAKGVRQSTAGVLAMIDNLGKVVSLRRDDVVLATARLSFGYGFGSSLLCSLAAGACTVLIRGAVDVQVVSAAIARHAPTVLCSVPRLYLSLLDAAEQSGADHLRSVRLCLSAGENCSPELAAQIRETFDAESINCLGATEVMHIAVTTADGGMGNLGRPIPGTTATLRGADGSPVADGEQGRLHLAGPTIGLGYLNRPQEQAATFADGGAYTGDVAYRMSDGTLQYVCRADDLLNLGGYKVAPVEIEEVVRSVDGVQDCVVVGVADQAGLDQAVAYVVPADEDPDQLAPSIKRTLRTDLAPYKRPARIELVDELPVTVTGKVAAHELRKRAVRP
jgi:acyl carrier protein